MTMTKRDFELIARVLSECRADFHNAPATPYNRGGLDSVNEVCVRFAAVLSETNAKFQRDRFLQECGISV